MSKNVGLFSGSRTSSQGFDDAVLLELGLFSVRSSDPRTERFQIAADRLQRLPFFCALHEHMMDFFKRNQVVHGEMSYMVWGGLAANWVLCTTGRCGIHYAFHDIELLFTKAGKIYRSDDLVEALRLEFMSDGSFLLDVDGEFIGTMKDGMSIEDFQRERLGLRDGDLWLNNLIVIVDCANGKVYAEAPAGTFQALFSGISKLEMKDGSDLRYIDRLARRIFRTVGKAIRFEEVAGLSLSDDSQDFLKRLLVSYAQKLEAHFAGLAMPEDEQTITATWIAGAGVGCPQTGKRWLYERVVSETAKRMAGLRGLSSLDREGFLIFVLGENPGGPPLFDHPLIQLVRSSLGEMVWESETMPRSEIARKCYEDFRAYQRPGAERLRDRYSMDATG